MSCFNCVVYYKELPLRSTQDVAVSRGVRGGDWSEGFLLQHAVIDAIYAAEMAHELGLSRLAQNQMLGDDLGWYGHAHTSMGRERNEYEKE